MPFKEWLHGEADGDEERASVRRLMDDETDTNNDDA